VPLQGALLPLSVAILPVEAGRLPHKVALLPWEVARLPETAVLTQVSHQRIALHVAPGVARLVCVPLVSGPPQATPESRPAESAWLALLAQ
jgi:hypothetical protein